MHSHIKEIVGIVVYCHRENKEPKAACPSVFFYGGNKCPPDERKEGLPMYVTYADLFQFCIFICALIGLCYTIFKGKKK